MARVDLHVHSRFSNHPSEWFLQRLGASESYTEPEQVYLHAREQGMTFVTITDHNSIDGALALCDAHPDTAFVSTEATTYFPEDGCKIHLLCYGLTEERFEDIQRLRSNIYDLRDYLMRKGIAHSCAHATYAVNSRLTPDHLEKLILLFDVFEGVNGGRSKRNNDPWRALLKQLSPSITDRLRDRHQIEPASDTPWIKGFTGGSDDHSGLFIGKTYTSSQADTIPDFLSGISHKRTVGEGRANDYQSLAFSIYKIAYEFSKTKQSAASSSLIHQVTDRLFGMATPTLTESLRFRAYSALKRRGSQSSLQDVFRDLLDTIGQCSSTPIEERLDTFYDHLARIADELEAMLIGSVEEDLAKGDLVGMVKNISSSLPGLFLAIPFFSTLKHFSHGRQLTDTLLDRFGIAQPQRSKRILWFTDTLTDMNGVSMTVSKIGWLAHLKDRDITIVTSLPPDQVTGDLPPNLINLPYIREFSLPHYKQCRLRMPSLLQSLKLLAETEPDEVYLSTPGPVGLFGALAGRLLNTRSTVVYHTDFTLQARNLIDDATVENLVEHYLQWFNALADTVRVPTREYIAILGKRGYDTGSMTVFQRGIDAFQFCPRETGTQVLAQRYGIRDGFTLMYAGRVSRDKRVVFLIDLVLSLRGEFPDLNLLVAGEGPDLDDLAERHRNDPRIVFTGRVGHDLLPELYSGADAFVFPSTTDTFGMVVLEAQSCGLPAIVSDIGGPKEIIINRRTGFIAREHGDESWGAVIRRLICLKRDNPRDYEHMRLEARQHVIATYDWNRVLDDLTGTVTTHATQPLPPIPASSPTPSMAV